MSADHPWGPSGKKVHELSPIALAVKLGLPESPSSFSTIDEVVTSVKARLREGESWKRLAHYVMGSWQGTLTDDEEMQSTFAWAEYERLGGDSSAHPWPVLTLEDE